MKNELEGEAKEADESVAKSAPARRITTTSSSTSTANEETLQRRLKKALKLVSIVKEKYKFERDVSSELARRNEELRAELEAANRRNNVLQTAFEELDEVTFTCIDSDLLPDSHVLRERQREIQGRVHDANASTNMNGLHVGDKKKKKKHRRSTNEICLNISEDEGSSLTRRMSIDFSRGASSRSSSIASSDFGEDSIHQFRDVVIPAQHTTDSSTYTVYQSELSVSETTGSSRRRLSSYEEGASSGAVFSGLVSTTCNTTTKSSISISSEDSGDTKSFPSSTSSPPTTGGAICAPLFEHFMVLGVSSDFAEEQAQKLFSEMMKGGSNSDDYRSESSFTRRGSEFLRRMGMGLGLGSSTANTPTTSSRSQTANADDNSTNTSERINRNFSSEKPVSAINSSKVSTPSRMGSALSRLFRKGSYEDNSHVHQSYTEEFDGSKRDNLSDTEAVHGSNDEVFEHLTDKSSNKKSRPSTCHVRSTATITDPSLLFRYPENVDPPPSELKFFCLPSGAMLRSIAADSVEETVSEIMYGQSQSKRTDRCFVFMLEDKTIQHDDSMIEREMEERGLGNDKLYGVCVIHSRLISKRMNACGDQNNSGEDVDVMIDDPEENCSTTIHFEADVCYAFVTRYPLFDFFFQILFDILSVERVARMELVAKLSGDDPYCDRHNYEYVPSELLRSILSILSTYPAPKFNQRIVAQISHHLAAREWTREMPPSDDYEERHIMFSMWSLPVVFDWLPPEIIVWALSLLVCEAKLLVVGAEAGIVTSTILGLMTLLHPFNWVAPFIPLLPIKHIDFIESPVPILAGVVIRTSANGIMGRHGDYRISSSAMTAISTVDKSQRTECGEDITNLLNIDPIDLLDRTGDGACGTICAVLDLTRRDIFIDIDSCEKVRSFIIPGAVNLIEKMKSSLGYKGVSGEYTSYPSGAQKTLWGVGSKYDKPNYNFSPLQRDKAIATQALIEEHVSVIVSKSKVFLREKASNIDSAIDNRRRENKSSYTELLQAIHSEPVMHDKDQIVETKGRSEKSVPFTEVFGSRNNPVASIGSFAFADFIDDYCEDDFFDRLISTQLYIDHLDNEVEEEKENCNSNDTEIEEDDDLSTLIADADLTPAPSVVEVENVAHGHLAESPLPSLKPKSKSIPRPKKDFIGKSASLDSKSSDSNEGNPTKLLRRVSANDRMSQSIPGSKALALRNGVSVLSKYGNYYDCNGEWSPKSPMLSKTYKFENVNHYAEDELGSSSSSAFLSDDKKTADGKTSGVVKLKTSRFGELSWSRISLEKQLH